MNSASSFRCLEYNQKIYTRTHCSAEPCGLHGGDSSGRLDALVGNVSGGSGREARHRLEGETSCHLPSFSVHARDTPIAYKFETAAENAS